MPALTASKNVATQVLAMPSASRFFQRTSCLLSLHSSLHLLLTFMSTNVSSTETTTTNILNIMSDKSLVDALHAFLSEYQLAFIVALGVVGFLTVIGLSSSKSAKKGTKTKKSAKKAPATPKRTPSKKEAAATRMAAKKGAAGSVETPAGRRSARIARKKVEQ